MVCQSTLASHGGKQASVLPTSVSTNTSTIPISLLLRAQIVVIHRQREEDAKVREAVVKEVLQRRLRAQSVEHLRQVKPIVEDVMIGAKPDDVPMINVISGTDRFVTSGRAVIVHWALVATWPTRTSWKASQPLRIKWYH